MPLPACGTSLPAELQSLISEFGRLWAASEARPKPSRSVAAHWTELLEEWAAAEDLPLLVRKHKDNRGAEVIHSTGRRLVPTDNSPAHWSFTLACAGIAPSLDNVRQWLADDMLPVVMIQKAVEKPGARYHCNLRPEFNVNESGWKLGHIAPVGLNTRQPLAEMPIHRLHASFQALLSPANMFVVPLAWSGLAEVDSVIQAIAARNDA